ncbi:FdhF/YdeP family oxidoreductase [Thalassotalea sp. HSM 43]|uniref:FdhF/YdeP family oxidoreductase n=1 Tax=Thalassotalea sp. HSM 43 TaxID=2552945 RepID=UPI001080BC39|nr:FdhF/YdeP family oxidoreductase [Thalassotalea sp. HSM 43]QBY04943.1 FdhF/YdeP family oxidoreductase [Thalassotalea sp. HSM 43]
MTSNNRNTVQFQQKPAKAGGIKSLQSTLKSIIKSQQPSTNIKSLLKANQDKGFDCPGCAWGDEKQGLIQFCENGAKAIAWESTSKTIDAAFFAEHTVSELKKQSDYWLEYQGRLAEPLRYNAELDKYQAISWSDAFALIASHLNQLEHVDQAEFYTSGRASNEAAFIYQLFGRLYGTNNFPDCSNMCHEASGVALKEAIGVGKGTVTLKDFSFADAIFVFGQNPGSNHPRMMNALRKSARNGCKIVTFNNLKEVALERFASPQDAVELLTPSATQISHAYFTPKLGGDMAAVRGIVKALLERYPQSLDRNFIEQHSQGLESYIELVEQTSWSKISEQSGLTQNDLRQAASVWANSDKVICCWAMGLTQHKHSVATIQEITNLQLLGGHIGKPGAGLCPVRGHSNVQGNRTVGINEKPPEAFIDSLSKVLQTPLPKAPGHNVYHALKSLLSKDSKVLVCLGGNIAQAAPDSERTYQALANTELNVQIATKLNRSHLYMGKDALILPCLGRTEIDRQTSGDQYITVEDTFSMVHASMGNVEPVSRQLKSEVAIIAGIAQATLGNDAIDWSNLTADYSNIRALISACLPEFNDFEQRLDHVGGFYLGNSASEHRWLNVAGKALFNSNPLPDELVPISQIALEDSKRERLLTMQTMRSHDQYNTTVYGMNDRYRGVVNGRKVLFINAQDAKRQQLSDGDLVTITSVWQDNIERQVSDFKIHLYDIPEGNVAGYYPETNPLVPMDSVGDKSFTPTSKAVAVYLQKQVSDRIL